MPWHLEGSETIPCQKSTTALIKGGVMPFPLRVYYYSHQWEYYYPLSVA